MNTISAELHKLTSVHGWASEAAPEDSGTQRRRIDAYVKRAEMTALDSGPRITEPYECPYNDSTCPYWHIDGFCYLELETGEDVRENCPAFNGVFL